MTTGVATQFTYALPSVSRAGTPLLFPIATQSRTYVLNNPFFTTQCAPPHTSTPPPTTGQLWPRTKQG